MRNVMLVAILSVATIALLAACGSAPTATPTSTPTPTAIQAASTPTPTPIQSSTSTPTPTSAPTATPTPAGRDMAAYFSGKTIKILVGFAPGGGYDTISRIFAAVAPKHFPGNPRFVVSNLPGGGGLRALQQTMMEPADGFTVTPMASRFIVPEVIGNDVQGFDLFTATMIGTPTYSPVHQTYCVRRDLATSWDQMVASGHTYTSGSSSPGGDAIGTAIMEYLGEPMHTVYGYGGTSEVLAAVDRGELDGTTRCDFNYIQPLYPQWITDHYVVPVYWWRTPIDQKWLDALGAPAPPYLFDIVNATAEEKAAFQFGDTAESMTRMFTMAPGVPDDIVATWRKAFKDTLNDPEFVQKANAASLEPGYGDPQILIDKLEAAKNFTDDGKNLLKYLYGLN